MTQHVRGGGFRPELNFVRVLAVMQVLLFHLEMRRLDHGYLGVDLFLLLSGFLIGQKILRDVENQQFSFIAFYSGRIKRILPAQYMLVFITLVAGYSILTPTNFVSLAQEAYASVLFYSNIYFNDQNGYFDTASVLKPLLHTWSLSLEEQFYLVLPIVLFLAYFVFKKQLKYFLYVLVIAALVFALVSKPENPNSTFFLLEYRAFEFLIGVFAASLVKNKLFNIPFAKLASLLGTIGCLTYPVLLCGVDSQSPLLALPLLLFVIPVFTCEPLSWVNKITQFAPIKIIGLSSYSIYLYHWPLIVFYKYYTLSELTYYPKLGLLAASIVLGLLSWQLIENPFRGKHNSFRTSVLPAFIFVLILNGIVVYGSKYIIKGAGLPERFPNEYMMTEKELNDERDRYWTGTNSDKAILKGSGKDTVLIIGNSFAIDLIYALRSNGFDNKIISLQSSHKCFNFSNAALVKEDSSFCSQLQKENFNATNWNSVKKIFLMDHLPRLDTINLLDFILKLRTFSKAKIFLLGPKMTFTKPIPDIVHSCNSASTYALNKFAQPYAEIIDRTTINNQLKKFCARRLNKLNVDYIEILNCSKDAFGNYKVVSESSNQFLYFDPSHFTSKGSEEMGSFLEENYPALF